MSDVLGIVEFEDDESVVAIQNSHLVERRCACGALSLADRAWRGVAMCGACRRDACGAGQGWAELAGRYTPVHGFKVVRQEAPQVAREAYPAPEVTSRDPWDGSGCPSAVLKLAEKAREASWEVRVQRSRGSAPHATHGRPGAVKWWYALVLGNGEWSAYAVHDGADWTSVMLWGRTRAWFASASVSDLAEYVSARGEVGDSWYAAIVDRERGKIARAKVRAACNRGTHVNVVTISAPGHVSMMHCSDCSNDWPAGERSWRKTKSGSGEAL